MVRVHLLLSVPPPFGWSYIFSTIWQAVQDPLKPVARVQEDAIWIECNLEEIGTRLFEELEQAVTQTNAQYRQWAREQAVTRGHRVQLESQLRSQLDDLTRTFSPADGLPENSGCGRSGWGAAFIAALSRLLCPGRRQRC